MRRRDFITLVGGAVVWPIATRAQQIGKIARIGHLSLASGPSPSSEGLLSGLRELGYVEGQNLVILYRWAAGRKDRLGDLATELLQLKVDVFASGSTEAVMAIRSINRTIPVVMTGVSDPIGSGLVASFARPGGNTTGVTIYSTELAGKRLQLLKEFVPRLARVAVLAERDHPPTAPLISETQAAARALRIELEIFEVHPGQIAETLKSIGSVDAIFVQASGSFIPYVRQIADFAISQHLPTMQEDRYFVEAGGLLAYGPSQFALGRRASWYVDRILKGMNPADLPVEQPTKFDLVINLKTAKRLGIDVPPSLLARADEVIE